MDFKPQIIQKKLSILESKSWSFRSYFSPDFDQFWSFVFSSYNMSRVAGSEKSFLRKYYAIMLQNPGDLYKFFRGDSHFFHSENNQPTDIYVGRENIFEAVKGLRFLDVSIDIASLDAQPTVNNDIVVVVTGIFTRSGNPPRQFIQTFFLAHQLNPNTGVKFTKCCLQNYFFYSSFPLFSLSQNTSLFVSNTIFRLLNSPEPTKVKVETVENGCQTDDEQREIDDTDYDMTGGDLI